jgi:hypothetical protein
MEKTTYSKRWWYSLLMAFLFVGFAGYGQNYIITNSALNVGNPGGVRTSSDATTSGETKILDGTTDGSGTENYWSSGQAIPFSFDFAGSPVTHFMVSKNGLVSFDTTLAGTKVASNINTNGFIPNANLPNNTIAMFWEDTATTTLGSNDDVWMKTEGTAPNRQLWIRYHSFKIGVSSFSYFACVLEETTNKIYVVDMSYASSASSYTGTVGMQTTGSTGWQVNTPLNGTLGTPNISMGSGGSSVSDNEYYEFQWFAAGACLPPSGLGISAITSSSATASWTSGGASNHFVEYGPTGFTLGSGSTMYVNAPTANLTGLSANTTYDVYVKDSCATSSSQYIGPSTFTTLCASQLSGTVTIDPGMPASATNFQTWTALAAELNACGVSGAGTVNVKQGTYTEQVEFMNFIGGSAANMVTIQSDPTNTMPVVLTHTPTSSATSSNYTLRFTGASNMTFMGITIETGGTTYGRLVLFNGDNNNIHFKKGIFNAINTTSSGTGYAHLYYLSPMSITNMSLDSNTFNNGSYIAYLIGSSGNPGDSVSITNNTSSNSKIGFYCTYIDRVTARNNVLDLQSHTSTQYGFYFGNGTSHTGVQATFEKNDIRMNTTGTMYGIYMSYFEASAVAPSSIINNFISNSATGTSGSKYGIYPYSVDYLNVFHNSVNVQNGSSFSSRAFYANSTTSTSVTVGNVDVRNNIFSNTSGGYCAEISSGANSRGMISTMNYNVYNYVASNTSPLRHNNTNYADVSAWNTGTTYGANSVAGDPIFQSVSDLHVIGTVANDVGDNSTGVADDIDDETRPQAPSTTVDIGADEYTPSSCSPPTGLTAFGVTNNSAMVTWTTGGAANWTVQYDTSGFALGTGMVMAAANDTVSLMNLMASTTYDVYVKDSCSPTSTSAWFGPVSFTTLCNPFVAPHTESFDGTSTPACWSQTATSGGPWLFTGSTNSVNCVAASDNTGNGGRFAWMDHSGGDAGVSLIMGVVDVSALTTPYLEFYYWMCGVGYTPPNKLYIDAWDGSAWVTADSIITATSGWEKQGFDLSSHTYGTGLLQIRFRTESGGSGSDFYGDPALDDVTVKEAPSCQSPTMLTPISATSSSLSFYFVGGGATDFNIEYDTTGFSPGTGMYMSSTNDTVTITGLNANTTYDIYVRDSCGPGNVSTWTGPLNMMTLCNTFTAPFMEDFEVATGTSGCWTQEADASNRMWTFATGSSGGLITVANSGSLNARHTSSSGGPHRTVLVSPIIDASTLTLPRLEFAYGQEQWFGDQCILAVYYRDSVNGTWNYLWSDSTDVSSWTNVILPFPSTSSTLQLGFEGTDNWGRAVVLDDVHLIETPSVCPVTDTAMTSNVASCGNSPVTLMATGVTQPNYEYVWMRGQDTAIVGTGDTYTTAPLTQSEDYYVGIFALDNTVPKQHVGPLSNIATSGYGNFSNGQWFHADDFFYLDSITVNSNGSVAFAVRISEAGPAGAGTEIMRSDTISVTGAGDHQVAVGLGIAPGNYFINIAFYSTGGTGQLFRATSGATYPYTISNLVSIDSVNFSGTRYYYTFDWVVSEVCHSPFALAQAIYAPSPSVAIPYMEDFNTGRPCNWTTQDIAGGADWMDINSYNGNSLDSSAFMMIDDDIAGSGVTTQSSLLSPVFNTQGYDTLWIEFDQYYRSSSNSSGSVEVWDGMTWQTVYTVTTTTGAWFTPDHQAIDITMYQNTDLQVRFRYDDGGDWAWYWSIDNFMMNGTQTPCENVVVDILTDNWGSETTWSIVDTATGTVYAQGGPYPDQVVTTYTDSVCLPIGIWYEFRVNDSYGDGLFDGTNTGTYDVNIICSWGLNNVISGSGAFPYGGPSGVAASWDSTVFEVTCAQPACPDPIWVSDSVSCATAIIDWISDSTGTTTIEYGATGFTPGMGNGTQVSNVMAPYQLTNLTYGTTYEYYLVDTCSNGNGSDWVGPFSITTEDLPVASFLKGMVPPANRLDTVEWNFNANPSQNELIQVWNYGDGSPLDTGLITSHFYTQNGTYDVILTVVNNCGSDSDTQQVVISTIDVEEFGMSNFELYPNPNNGKFRLNGTLDVGGEIQVEVLSMTGAAVYSKTVNTGQEIDLEIDLRGKASGMYQVRLISAKGVGVKPFVLRE